MGALERRLALLETKAATRLSVYDISDDDLEARLKRHFSGRTPTEDELRRLLRVAKSATPDCQHIELR